MTNLRRYWQSGHTYFLTHVTYDRRPLLLEHAGLLWQAIEKVKSTSPFELPAWVILEDHFHVIINARENNPSRLMKQIKLLFSGSYRSAMKLTSGRIWQYRFWDHMIRDQEDLNRHIDYIHYNPVKHGLVADPFAHLHSSIHEFFTRGYYCRDWGVRDSLKFDGDFGE